MIGFEKMIGWSTMSKRLKRREVERERGGRRGRVRERERERERERGERKEKKGNRKRHGNNGEDYIKKKQELKKYQQKNLSE